MYREGQFGIDCKKYFFREIEISVFSENFNLKISVEEGSLLTTNSHITQVDYIIFTNLLLLVLFWQEICKNDG